MPRIPPYAWVDAPLSLRCWRKGLGPLAPLDAQPQPPPEPDQEPTPGAAEAPEHAAAMQQAVTLLSATLQVVMACRLSAATAHRHGLPTGDSLRVP